LLLVPTLSPEDGEAHARDGDVAHPHRQELDRGGRSGGDRDGRDTDAEELTRPARQDAGFDRGVGEGEPGAHHDGAVHGHGGIQRLRQSVEVWSVVDQRVDDGASEEDERVGVDVGPPLPERADRRTLAPVEADQDAGDGRFRDERE
jgi:hypothetical protein